MGEKRCVLINKGEFYKIRPAARLITSIGEGLIKDISAAIVELVKNAYDADASYVQITFSSILNNEEGQDNLKIVIKDDGHGMSFDTVLNKWMVPATNDKLKRKYSLFKRRVMQGRKGIGRYAVAILGSKLTMETIDVTGVKTRAEIDWDDFENQQFLNDVEILIHHEKVSNTSKVIESLAREDAPEKLIEEIYKIEDAELLESIYEELCSKTELHIIGDNSKLLQWSEAEIELLIKDLKKLLSPLKENKGFRDQFNIKLSFDNFPVENYQNNHIEIAPFPLYDMYDYRIYGQVDENGYASLVYENNTEIGIPRESLNVFNMNLDTADYCGPIEIDLRVFDKDPEAINNLLQKGNGLKSNNNEKFLGKLEVRSLIKEISGISIYRGDFRIRPYGDRGYDWLELDKERVQNPSQRIGNDQVVGFVKIASEEVSHLEEKSARDGLKENKYYEGLRQIVGSVLSELESRRYIYRKKTGRGRKQTLIQEQLVNLFDFNGLTNKIENKLQSLQIEEKSILELKEIIKKTEEEKSHILDEIQKTIAIYQGQATLGKIIMVIQHEGRRPLGYIKNQVPLITTWSNKLMESDEVNKDLLARIIDRLQVSKDQMEIITQLFNKLTPLSFNKRANKKDFKVSEALKKIAELYENELKLYNIELHISCKEDYVLSGWIEDIVICLTNLLENSIHWLNNYEIEEKKIVISVFEDEGKALIIDVIDNGPGVAKKFLEENAIFDPGFTTKTGGTGLGLAIAGEAISRNNGKLKALHSDEGAYFRIEFKEQRLND
ncbi:ATP-binding protein [Bacillus cereus]|uniref:ATP-binding protein n=1 Tax=Bacillus cereus TaxID=1396 RepID=UPI001443D865|nr:sensor histidine kinase [Bacillus cereus]